MNRIQEQFPLLRERVYGKPIVYLDNAVTARRPVSILKAVDDPCRYDNANSHCGVYGLIVCTTDTFEGARKVVTGFIGVEGTAELIFIRNVIETLNLIAYNYGLSLLSEGDDITISITEHHSNLVPQQYITEIVGASLNCPYLTDGARIFDEEITAKITRKTKLVSVTHISNVLGVQLLVEKTVKRAHEVGAIMVLNCVQSIPHFPVDVEKLGVDFVVFFGHKMYAPLGIGVLWGRRELLEEMPPFLSGGNMIDPVEEQVTTYAPIPQKFEAGIQDAAGMVGLVTAVESMQEIGWEKVTHIEHGLMAYAPGGMRQIPHVAILSNDIPANERYGAVSLLVEDVRPHDVASILDADSVCIRTGHHYAQPLLHHLDVYATSRISFTVHSIKEDIDAFLESLKKVRGVMGYEA